MAAITPEMETMMASEREAKSKRRLSGQPSLERGGRLPERYPYER